MKPTLIAVLALAASSASAEVSCYKLGSIVSCSDGTHIQRLGSSTKITRQGRAGIETTTCSKLGSRLTCR